MSVPIKTVGTQLGYRSATSARPRTASQLQYNIVRIDGQKSAYIPIMKQGGDTQYDPGGRRRPQSDRPSVRSSPAVEDRHRVSINRYS